MLSKENKTMKENASVLLLLAIVLLAIGTPLLVNDFVFVSDFWERQRVSAEIISTGSLPHFNSSYIPESPYVYPLGLDALNSFLSISSGLSFLEIAQAMGFIITALLALLVYLFVGRISSKRIGIIAALFVALMPRIARLGMQPIPELFGLVLIAFSLLLLARRNYNVLGLVLAATLLFHYRSFLNEVLVIALFMVLYRKEIDFAKAKWVCLFPLLMVPVYLAGNIIPALGSHSISNPFVIEWNPLRLFGPVCLVAIVGLAWAVKNRMHWFLSAWLGVFALIYAFGGMQSNVFQFREIVYAFIPIAGLAAAFIASKREYLRLLVPIAGVAFLVMLVVNLETYPSIDAPDVGALKFLKNSRDKTVMGSYLEGYGIPVISGKKVVVGAFMEGVPDAEERISDLNEFLSTTSPARARSLAEKYGTKTILIGRLETRNFYGKKFDLEKFESVEFDKIYANDNDWVLRAN